MRAYNFLFFWIKVHQIFNPNVVRVVVDNLLFRFSLSQSILESYVLKVESC